MRVAAAGNLFDLSGKVALLTGATRGIGRAMAEAMAAHGAAVVISSEVSEECAAVAAELRTAGHRAAGIACDVSSRTQLQQLVTQTTQQLGRIDILACNAGVAPHAGPIASATDAEWDLTMTVNLRSVLWLTSLVIPGMAERGEPTVGVLHPGEAAEPTARDVLEEDPFHRVLRAEGEDLVDVRHGQHAFMVTH